MPIDTKTNRILRLILMLSNSYPKTREECCSFLGIRESTFFNYRNMLIDLGFDFHQKEGKYRIEFPVHDHQILRNILHFSEEESYLLARCLDKLEELPGISKQLKIKLSAFLNQDKVIEEYLHKEKSELEDALWKAKKEKKQILLVNYASGNSQTVRDRLVEPFEFKDDFNLMWAFDTELKQNRQFKICRIEDIVESPISWEYEAQHHSSPVDIFRNTGNLDKEVVCRLNLKAKNLLTEEYPLAERYLTQEEGQQFILRAPVAKYEGPCRFVLGLAEDILPTGDDGFIEYLKEKVKKCQIFI